MRKLCLAAALAATLLTGSAALANDAPATSASSASFDPFNLSMNALSSKKDKGDQDKDKDKGGDKDKPPKVDPPAPPPPRSPMCPTPPIYIGIWWKWW